MEKRKVIKTKEQFNERLKEKNSNLIAVSEYNGKNNKIKVKCLNCNKIMDHKTAHSWLYETARCYYCENLPFSNKVESYKDYVERNTEGRITPISEYKGADKYMQYRCNLHDEIFAQSHSELFRKDGKGGCLCYKCKGKDISNNSTPEELMKIAKMYAPNLEFFGIFRNLTNRVEYKCTLCGYTNSTSISTLKRSEKAKVFCPQCNNILKKTTNKFESELQALNNSLYVCSEYNGVYKRIEVGCKKCKRIMNHKAPKQWLKCAKCYYCDNQPFNPDVELYSEFVQRKYGTGYSVITEGWYGAKSKHEFFCNIHKESFWQTPDSFSTETASCSMCEELRNKEWIKKITKDHIQFVKELANVSPDIEVLGRYRSANEEIAVRCKKCNHEWAPTAGDLLYQKTQCPKCTGVLLDAKVFKKKVKKSSPTIDVIGKFYRGRNKIKVKCKICNDIWDASKNVLIKGCGCKRCQIKGTSKQELMLLNSIENIWPSDKILFRDHSLIGKELDIVIVDKRVAIEIGHFNYHKCKIEYDYSKEEDCKKKGIILYTIYYGCGDSDIRNSFERLKCFKEDASNKSDIIKLVYECIAWIAKSQNWGELYKRIDYDSIWNAVAQRMVKDRKSKQTTKSVNAKNIKQTIKYTSKEFEKEVNKIRDDCRIIDDYIDENTKLRISCKQCNNINKPMLPAHILTGRKLDCFRLHEFENHMKTNHKNIEYCIDDFQKDSMDCRKNHIRCRCLLCGKKWAPTVDSLLRNHGCPNYRDERHERVIKTKVNSWLNGSNMHVMRDDGVYYKSITAASEAENISHNRLRLAIEKQNVINGHYYTLVKRDTRIRRKSTDEVFEDINVATFITGLSKAYIYRHIEKDMDFEWVIPREKNSCVE